MTLMTAVMAAENSALPFTFTFIHLADVFIQSDLQVRNTIFDTL